MNAILIVLLGQSDAAVHRQAGARGAVAALASAATPFLWSVVLPVFWSLSARAFTTSVQMLWTYVSAASLSDGLTDDQRGTWLHERILITWALLLTLAGSAATVQLLRWREKLTDEPEMQAAVEAAAKAADEAAAEAAAEAVRVSQAETAANGNGAGASGTDGTGGAGGEAHGDRPGPWQLRTQGWSRLSETWLGDMPDLFEPQAQSDAHAIAERRRLWLRAAATRVLLLCERVLSYVTAWAWCDVFFAQSARASVWLALQDSTVAVLLTVAVLGWLVFVGGALEVNAGVDRAVVESYFFANSASFFVGWSWWKVLRDLAAVSGRAAVVSAGAVGGAAVVGGAVAGGVPDAGASELTPELSDLQYAGSREFAGALIGNVVYGPILSVVVVYLKHVALRDFLASAEAAGPMDPQSTIRRRLVMLDRSQV